ncbi:hydantoinase/oxoprolinase [Synergistales bacterium]|nr:hydantoinase/oxoprolinase [Synergistales bacterium]
MEKIGIGIDAGGTYTDAVAYSFERREVLASAKALTRKEDLSAGIEEALDALPVEFVRGASCAALSTTLATNACVEDKGCRGKLLFIGVDPFVINWVGDEYGLPPLSEIRVIEKNRGEEKCFYTKEEWRTFYEANSDWFKDAAGIAVVDIDAMDNCAALEKDIREKIWETCGLPVICGHELSSELNSIRRGAGTLLNIRLIPLISEFIEAVRLSFSRRGMEDVPIYIVRSDGTLMSDSFTKERPVETLLCGPAAGLIGSAYLTGNQNCLVIDMGGTTTDISLIHKGKPKKAAEGVHIGKWKTFVKGAFVDTFALGGDSTIRIDRGNALNNEWSLSLEDVRSMPFCMAADRWPRIKDRLHSLLVTKHRHTLPIQEFFMLIKDINGTDQFSGEEQKFCRALRNGPLIFSDAARVMGKDIYDFNVSRLEREGVVLRCGLTPTDIMHLKGDFERYDKEAARLGALFVASGVGMSLDELGDRVYDMVKQKLYRNIVRILIQSQHPKLQDRGFDADLELIIGQAWETARENPPARFLLPVFQTPLTLVGIGAPIHHFLPDVAKALSAEWEIPRNAPVVNALGAIVSHVETVCRVKVIMNEAGKYQVCGMYENFTTPDKEQALENAREQCERAAREEAHNRGITDKLQVETTCKDSIYYYPGHKDGIYLWSWVTTTVSGSVL